VKPRERSRIDRTTWNTRKLPSNRILVDSSSVGVEVPATASRVAPDEAPKRFRGVIQLFGDPHPNPRALAVLVVAYRSADKLETCLAAVGRHLPDSDVHVWDNSGPDHSDVRRLANRMSHVHWHLGSDNIGFARAVNALAAALPNVDLLLVNPDAELVGPLSLTLATLDHQDTAAAAPMTSESEGDVPTASFLSRKHMPWDNAHRKPTLLNAIGGPLGVAERLRGTPLSNLFRVQPTAVDGYLTGACLAIRRQAWDSVGPFDEEFFLYGEEADWQRRAVEAGWRLRLADEIAVIHRANGTVTGDSTGLRRSKDLLRAGIALQLEYRYGVRTAEVYLAAVSLCEGIKQKLRGRRSRAGVPPAVLVTLDGVRDANVVAERIQIVLALARGGFEVTVVSLQRLGSLPQELPTSIRLLRRPWWWPSTLPENTPSILVCGTTERERAFARLFRIRRSRTCVEADVAIDVLVNASPERRNPDSLQSAGGS
jgi:GT2 family glycosyltransferase